MRIILQTLLNGLFLSLCLSLSQAQAQTLGPLLKPLDNIDNAETFLDVDVAYVPDHVIEGDRLILRWQIADGYYLYRHGFNFNWEDQGRWNADQMAIERGLEKSDEFFGSVETYRNGIQVAIPLDEIDQQDFSVTIQGCADKGLCYPPRKLSYTADQAKQLVSDTRAQELAEKTNTEQPDAGNPAPQNPATTDWQLVLLAWVSAFFGGMILNLMPCVFPVLSIKVFQLVQHTETTEAKRQSLAYLAGSVVSFVTVAAIMLAVRASGSAVGWGFQLQNPWFVGLLIYLFFALGLSMSGFWHFGERFMGTGQSLTTKQGAKGAFFTGVLAVLVASPCTAPFMGSALGVALTQPAWVSLTIFAALGTGMAFPLAIIGFAPALARLLPKPGAWMNTFKELFAFPLYATAIWLTWVLANQAGSNAVALILTGCLLTTLTLWAWQRQGHVYRTVGLVALITALYLPFSSLFHQGAIVSNAHADQDHVVFSEKALEAYRQRGDAVFVDLTADWCITCLANEARVLNTEEVRNTMKENNITLMIGDWTDYDEEITHYINRFGRNGIPLYVYYPAGKGSEPIVLPQILQSEHLISVLNETP
ncbi:Thiol:disulfide interchange protein DsbD [BD1-7 clade bacterium]|uniref:Thiol:disulfide interchange protein DsbD n=1 Tax=BD1-7 clade bacterium TaxID=2029982 RepID=A0A5S9Q7Z5_9GAMM|nr:Thiol:disulfide interchange protein DsbD [BD1-7 clade bacterium]CAA0114082.1 Thiol:disulfide interchange protein DsbD [BD1-7 clade bacterium]